VHYTRVEDGMIEVIIALAGTLLLIAAGSKPRVAPVPVRVNHRKR
jgi:hypothetical protein